MRVSGSEDFNDTSKCRVSAGSHVHGLGGQPDGVDTDQRSHSRSQAAQAPAPSKGQFTVMVLLPL